jgi:hypothetical protein
MYTFFLQTLLSLLRYIRMAGKGSKMLSRQKYQGQIEEEALPQ